jgi:hypothetical protein
MIWVQELYGYGCHGKYHGTVFFCHLHVKLQRPSRRVLTFPFAFFELRLFLMFLVETMGHTQQIIECSSDTFDPSDVPGLKSKYLLVAHRLLHV